MWTHEVQLGGMVVAGHEEVGLVLVGGRVRCGGLRRRCQSLEVELVGVSLPVHLCHDILVIVVPAQSDSTTFTDIDCTSNRSHYLILS